MAFTLVGAVGVAFVAANPSAAGVRAWLREAASEHPLAVFFVCIGLVALAVAVWRGYLRYSWHLLANVFAGRPRLLRAPWVVDGDTIDDLRTGKRYRLANIDAPETGAHARCHYERQRGEEAKRVAELLVRSASHVSVRETWRVDRYGRHVAYVLIDGDDLGTLLLRRGLARPWRGRRRRWCGPKGGLARMAVAGHAPHVCRTCGANPRAERAR